MTILVPDELQYGVKTELRVYKIQVETWGCLPKHAPILELKR